MNTRFNSFKILVFDITFMLGVSQFPTRQRYQTIGEYQMESQSIKHSHFSKNPSTVLKQFQEDLASIKMGKRLRTQAKHRPDGRKSLREKSIDSLKFDLSQIRKELKMQQKHKAINHKLQQMIEKHSARKEYQENMLQRIPQSVIIPMPMPINPQNYFNYPYPFSSRQRNMPDRYPLKTARSSIRSKIRKQNGNKMVQSSEDRARKKELRKIMRKGFYVVAYTVFLKNLVKKIKGKRKIMFQNYWPQNFEGSMMGVRKWIASRCRIFFQQMEQKCFYQLNIQIDDKGSEIKRKKAENISLLTTFIKCLNKLATDTSFEEVCKIFLLFCKHGSLIQDEVLTWEEAKTVCLGPKGSFLMMDAALQKSQLINLVFMKVILFNLLLAPWKYSQSNFGLSKNPQAYENFYFFSSLFYRICKQVQRQYLQKDHPFSIKLGNFKKLNLKTTFSPSLVSLEASYQKGEMISGLLSQQALDKILPSFPWEEFAQDLKIVVQKMHSRLRRTYWNFVNSVYLYKDVQILDN